MLDAKLLRVTLAHILDIYSSVFVFAVVLTVLLEKQ